MHTASSISNCQHLESSPTSESHWRNTKAYIYPPMKHHSARGRTACGSWNERCSSCRHKYLDSWSPVSDALWGGHRTLRRWTLARVVCSWRRAHSANCCHGSSCRNLRSVMLRENSYCEVTQLLQGWLEGLSHRKGIKEFREGGYIPTEIHDGWKSCPVSGLWGHTHTSGYIPVCLCLKTVRAEPYK